jgi:tRNA threonylcarbamoyladenosine biosynthesis protein TsaB
MIILGIDTSTDQLGLGLSDGQSIMAEIHDSSSREHASQIMGGIDRLLKQTEIDKASITGLAVAIGPGSFTGLRIGLAVAKGMALALNLPIIGVSTYEVMAARLLKEFKSFYLTSPVRRGEYYLVHITGGADIRKSIITVTAENFPQQVGSTPVGLVGREPDGWQAVPKTEIPRDRLIVSGGELALLGANLLNTGRSDDLATLEPLYIVASQAEIKYGQR